MVVNLQGCEVWNWMDLDGHFFSGRSEEGKVSKVLASTFAHMLSKVGERIHEMYWMDEESILAITACKVCQGTMSLWLLQCKIYIMISCTSKSYVYIYIIIYKDTYISWKINLHATRFLPSKRVPSCQPLLSRGFPQGRKKAQSFLSAAQEALPTVGVDVWKIEVWDNLLRGAKRGRKDVAIFFQTCLFLF